MALRAPRMITDLPWGRDLLKLHQGVLGQGLGTEATQG
jgi:hypothetical protein